MNPIETLWQEERSLTSIEKLESPPSPLEFLRKYVSQNKPCLISNAISHWPALSLWPSPTYLSHSLSSSLVSLHLTPNGHADSLTPLTLNPNPQRPGITECAPLRTPKPQHSEKPEGALLRTPMLELTEKPDQTRLTESAPVITRMPGKLEQVEITESALFRTQKPEKVDKAEIMKSAVETENHGDYEQYGVARNAVNPENPFRDGDDPDTIFGLSPDRKKLHQTGRTIGFELMESAREDENRDSIVWFGDSGQPGLRESALESENDDPDTARLCFASAFVMKTAFDEAINMVLSSGPCGPVAYLQQQNDCFRDEYGVLSGDCDGDIDWASEAFGCLPEAVNLWIGNEFSETSWHKDHYENIYAVVSGEKKFLLLPPTDVHRMYVREYPAASYVYDKETREFKLVLDEPKRYVPWCSVDPYPSPENKARDVARFPLYFNGPKPFEVTVKAGEILYLPSMWFHYVRQGADDHGRTIAINYWYDMQFDIKYAYFNFLSSIPYHIVDGNMYPKLEDKESDSVTLV